MSCFFVFQLAAQSKKATDIIYAGTFSLRESKGIYVMQFDRKTGNLTELQTVDAGKNPSYLTVHPNGKYVYAVFDEGTIKDGKGSVMTFKIDPATGKLTKMNEQSSEGRGPVHVSLDPKGRFAYVSNYGSGTLTVYPINADGTLSKPSDIVQHAGSSVNPERQTGPHAHSTTPSPDGKFIYTSDLGMDKIMIYEVQNNGKLLPAKVPFEKNTPGSGPRHFATTPDGNFAFSAEEIMSSLATFKVNKSTGELTPLERIKTIPETFTERNSAADVHVSPDGKFVYLSNRGHNSLAIYGIDKSTGKLSYVGNESTGGGHPRNFMMDRNGDFIFVANRDADNIVVFKRDKSTGKLTKIGTPATVPAIVCLQQL